MVLLVVRRGGVFKKARTDDPTHPTRRGEATNDPDDCVSCQAASALSPGHFIRQSDHKKSKQRESPRRKYLQTTLHIAHAPREGRRVSSNKAQLSQPLGLVFRRASVRRPERPTARLHIRQAARVRPRTPHGALTLSASRARPPPRQFAANRTRASRLDSLERRPRPQWPHTDRHAPELASLRFVALRRGL